MIRTLERVAKGTCITCDTAMTIEWDDANKIVYCPVCKNPFTVIKEQQLLGDKWCEVNVKII